MIKAPKLYFTDVGIASYLLGIQSTEQLKHEKLRGHLFENLVIMELLKFRYNQGQDSNLYFYRDSHHNEVDIIMPLHNKLIPIEIKSTATFHPGLLKNIRYFQNLAKDRAPIGFLVYAGEETIIDNINLVHFSNMHKLMNTVNQTQA